MEHSPMHLEEPVLKGMTKSKCLEDLVLVVSSFPGPWWGLAVLILIADVVIYKVEGLSLVFRKIFLNLVFYIFVMQ